MDPVELTLGTIRAKAAELRDSFGDEARARALEWAAEQFRQAIDVQDDETMTLIEAASRSGYSIDHLARLIREGRLPNAGRRGAPRVRLRDLPIRLRRSVAASEPRAYDPVTDARQLRGRR